MITLSTVRKQLGRHLRYRKIRAELSAHSDRELADLGILRCDVDRFARKAAVR